MSNQALRMAKNELSMNRRTTSAISSLNLNAVQRKSILRSNQDHIENNKFQIAGLDPKYLDDENTYKPSTEYSVVLNLKKEFIRHKRVMCSIKEFAGFDIQNKWDIGYC